jgi:hypothetical protein
MMGLPNGQHEFIVMNRSIQSQALASADWLSNLPAYAEA